MDVQVEVNERKYERQVLNARVLYYIWSTVLSSILYMVTVTAVDLVHSVTCMKSHDIDFVMSLVLSAHWFGVLVLNLPEIACQSNSVDSTMILYFAWIFC